MKRPNRGSEGHAATRRSTPNQVGSESWCSAQDDDSRIRITIGTDPIRRTLWLRAETTKRLSFDTSGQGPQDDQALVDLLLLTARLAEVLQARHSPAA